MRVFAATAFVLPTAWTSSCTNKAGPVVAPPMNTTCPIMGGKVTVDDGFTTWNDRLIGLCCDSCIPDWNKLSDEDETRRLADEITATGKTLITTVNRMADHPHIVSGRWERTRLARFQSMRTGLAGRSLFPMAIPPGGSHDEVKSFRRPAIKRSRQHS